MEARVAVMRGQWGWAVYAVQECRAGQRLGWYDGDVVGSDEWDAMGQGEGRPSRKSRLLSTPEQLRKESMSI